jgi:hypothetical protein
MAKEAMNSFLLPPGTYAEKAVPPGEWREFDGFSFLATIADGLDVRHVQGELDDIISIPDLWAQVAGFGGALASQSHPRHGTTVTEWRALIALLALGQVRGLPLDFLSIAIDNGAAAVQRDDLLTFGAVAMQHCPANKVLADMDWRRLVILRYNGKPVALLNPWTLLCPVRDHLDALDTSLPWFVNGQINDPVAGDYLDRHDMELLLEYCGRLGGKLAEWSREKPDDVDIELVNILARQFNDFETATRQAADLRRLGSLNVPAGAPQAYPDGVGLSAFHWLYRELASSGDPGGVEDGYDIMMPARPEFGGTIIGGLLIDPTIAATFDAPVTAIKAWKRHSLASLINPSQTLRDGVLDQLALAKVIMIAPDDLFTSRLLRVVEGSIPGHGTQAGGFVLPVTPLLLLFLTPDELRDALSIRAAGQGYEVEIRIRLQSRDGDSKLHRLRRSYAAEKVTTVGRPSALAVWPNFVHPEWPRYFVLSRIETRAKPPRGRGLVTVKALQAALESGPADTVGSLTQALVAATRRLEPEYMEYGQCELLAADGPVEAVICDIPLETPGADASERLMGGLVMFRYSDTRAPKGRGAELRIGIDFGTTNTTVFSRLNNGTPTPLSFANRFVHAFDGGYDMGIAALAKHMFPCKAISTPFLTALFERNHDEGLRVRTLWSDRIEFGEENLVEQLKRLGNPIGPANGRLHYDIKWGQTAERRRLVRAFLSQTVLMAAAEALDMGAKFESIEWNLSFPEAFSRAQTQAFQSIVPQAITDALGLVPTNQTLKFRPESFATALYFNASQKAYFHNTAIAIDMGGKTSDISIWQDGKPVWQNSVKLAGRNILINYLARNPDLFAVIDCESAQGRNGRPIGESVAKMIRTATKGQPSPDAAISEAAIHMTETVVNSTWYTETFERNYPQISGDPALVKLRLLAELCLAGLLHYVAKVVSHFVEAETMVGNDSTVTICMGGRGSLLFQFWFGEARQIMPFAPLAKMFHKASGLRAVPDTLRFSDRPKLEVAYGLLVDPSATLAAEAADVSKVLPLGSKVLVGGTSYPATTLMGDLPINQSWKLGSIDMFRAFLEQHQTGSRCILPMHLLSDTDFLGAVGAGIANARSISAEGGGDAAAEAPEPPFIILLRALVERIARDPELTIRER